LVKKPKKDKKTEESEDLEEDKEDEKPRKARSPPEEEFDDDEDEDDEDFDLDDDDDDEDEDEDREPEDLEDEDEDEDEDEVKKKPKKSKKSKSKPKKKKKKGSKNGGEGLAKFALIAGLVAALLAFLNIPGHFIPIVNVWCFGCFFGPVGGLAFVGGVILGIVSLVMGAGEEKKKAITGLILCGVALFLWTGFGILIAILRWVF
jgi:hypothetical protein